MNHYNDVLALWSQLREVAVMARETNCVTAYSWIVFSSQPQEQGDSVRRQTDLRNAWLKRHPNVTLDKSLKPPERAVSRFGDEARTNLEYALAQFVKKVEENLVKPGSYLIVENLDRLTRENPVISIPFVLNLVAKGIRIVQLAPTEIIYDVDMDQGKLMMMLFDLSRGHGESKRKSQLVGDAWGQKKRAAREGVPHGKTVPSWIELRDGKYHLIPEKAKTVQLIFRWCIEGKGHCEVIRQLDKMGIPPISGGSHWARSYIAWILKTRATVGEYQPRKGRRGGRAVDGDPIPGYWPAVVKEHVWHAAQKAKQARYSRTGRTNKKGAYSTPFAGLLYSALDGEKLHVNFNRGRHYFISAGKTDVKPGAEHGRFDVGHLCNGLLSQLIELAATDLFRDPSAGVIEEIEAQMGEVGEKLKVARRHFHADRESAVWAEEVTILDKQWRALRDQRDNASREAATPLSAIWSEAVALMRRNEPVRLRQCLLATVEAIWCVFVRRSQAEKLAAVQVVFSGGETKRTYIILSKSPQGNFKVKAGRSWVARSLEEVTKGAFDMAKPAGAKKMEKVLERLDLTDF